MAGAPRAGAAGGAADVDKALPIVKRALKVLADREVTPQLGLLKSTLLQLDSTFSEREYGASTFRDFIEKVAERGLVVLRQAGRSVLVELADNNLSALVSDQPPASEPPPTVADAQLGRIRGRETPDVVDAVEGRGRRRQRAAPPRTAAAPSPQQTADAARLASDLFAKSRQTPRWPMYIRQMRQFFRNADDTFDERKLGFPGIVDFLRACQREGLLRLDRDRQGVLRVFPGANFAKPATASSRRRARDRRRQRGRVPGRRRRRRRRHRRLRNALHPRDRRRHHADHRRHRRRDAQAGARRGRSQRRPRQRRAALRNAPQAHAKGCDAARGDHDEEGRGRKDAEDATSAKEREGDKARVNCGLRRAACGFSEGQRLRFSGSPSRWWASPHSSAIPKSTRASWRIASASSGWKSRASSSALGLKPGQLVVDLGSGSGLFTRALARAVAPNGTAYAVDIDPALLKIVESSAKRSDIKNLTTVLAAPDDPKLPQAVDVIFICDTFHHLPDKPTYARTLYRYLKPGGRVAVIDFTNDWPGGHDAMRYTPDDLERWMTGAGFTRDQSFDFPKNSFYITYKKASQ